MTGNLHEIIINLSVELTENEWRERSVELAATSVEITKVEDEKKAYDQSAKSKIDQLNVKRKLLADAVHTRKENRDIECQWSHDYRSGKALLIRADTGEIIKERDLSASELQLPIPHDDIDNSEVRFIEEKPTTGN